MSNKATAKTEVENNETIDFDFELHNGEKITFNVPSNLEDVDIEILESLEDNRPVNFVRSLLGNEQFNEFKSKGAKIKDIATFTEAYTEATVGVNPKAS